MDFTRGAELRRIRVHLNGNFQNLFGDRIHLTPQQKQGIWEIMEYRDEGYEPGLGLPSRLVYIFEFSDVDHMIERLPQIQRQLDAIAFQQEVTHGTVRNAG